MFMKILTDIYVINKNLHILFSIPSTSLVIGKLIFYDLYVLKY